jgi:hypothetical protein
MISQSTIAKPSRAPLPFLAVKFWALYGATWLLVGVCLFCNAVIQRATRLHGRLFAKMTACRDGIACLKKST